MKYLIFGTAILGLFLGCAHQKPEMAEGNLFKCSFERASKDPLTSPEVCYGDLRKSVSEAKEVAQASCQMKPGFQFAGCFEALPRDDAGAHGNVLISVPSK